MNCYRTLVQTAAVRVVTTFLVVAVSAAALAGCRTSTKKATPEQVASATRAANADEAFEKGANKPPKAGTLYSLAKILAVQGRDPEAMTVLRSLIQRYPDFMPAYNALAEAHLRAERPADAAAVLEAALARRPDDGILLNNLGMTWFLHGKYNNALGMFDRATAAHPKEPTYAFNKAMALGMLGRTREAEAVYSQHLQFWDTRHNLRVLAKARQADGRDRDGRAAASPDAPPATQPAGEPAGDPTAADGPDHAS